MVLHAVVPSAASLSEDAATIRLRVHGHETSLELCGDLASSVVARDLLRRLHVVQRRLSTTTEVVHLDLRGLTHITIEVAVLLCVQRRLLAARGVAVGAVLRTRGEDYPAAVERILEALAGGTERPEISDES